MKADKLAKQAGEIEQRLKQLSQPPSLNSTLSKPLAPSEAEVGADGSLLPHDQALHTQLSGLRDPLDDAAAPAQQPLDSPLYDLETYDAADVDLDAYDEMHGVIGPGSGGGGFGSGFGSVVLTANSEEQAAEIRRAVALAEGAGLDSQPASPITADAEAIAGLAPEFPFAAAPADERYALLSGLYWLGHNQ